MHNLALIGKARSGKDTAAAHLVRTRSYTRLAFADPLKEMVIDINPFVPASFGVTVRLRALIADVGWEYAKDHYPEVRRILQSVGQSVRERDEDYWTSIVRRKISAAEEWNMPVVVSDVRYPSEAFMLKARGFRLVRIVRPNPITGKVHPPASEAARHSSETALDGFAADETIYNAGTIADLEARVSLL
ncbi:hypothetical protein OG548_08185 [Streptomyces sp. NBC_01356]|uniref:deoxynucleotide monophosphate kinase family protein n=1 Tax=Streptomyces sp. NBC_01356 TaxID=2903836 RepID=UPI002E2EA62B|nr:hypothetical protein [Streptomyces sp. NBC_01356]